MTGMYVMHHAFRRDLAAFASSVRATPLGDRHDVGGPRPALGAGSPLTLHHHHSAEDTHYWPVLETAVAARGTDADLAEVHAMSEEHADIDPLVSAVRRRLRRGRRSTRARSTATPSTSGSPACARCSTSTCATRRPWCSRWCSG